MHAVFQLVSKQIAQYHAVIVSMVINICMRDDQEGSLQHKRLLHKSIIALEYTNQAVQRMQRASEILYTFDLSVQVVHFAVYLPYMVT